MKKWLVTGASGLLGANAGIYLHDKVRVFGICRSGGNLYGYEKVFAVDILDELAVRKIIEELKPDVILHAAALASHEACERDPGAAYALNVSATKNIAEASELVGAKFLYISTDAVFDGAKGNYSETDITNPFSVYGETKLLGEYAAIAASPESLVVRTNFFGWSISGNRSILEFFVNSLRDNKVINGYVDSIVSSIHTHDLMDSIFFLVDKGNQGIIHITSTNALSKYEFGMAVARLANLNGGLITPVSGNRKIFEISRVRNISLDVNRANSRLGRDLPSIEEGISRSLATENSFSTNARS